MPTYETRHGHPRIKRADGSRQRNRRREEAEVRQTKRDSLTNAQQIEKLNKLLGKNTGAIKERIRLHSPEQPTKKAGPKSRKKKARIEKARQIYNKRLDNI